MSISLLFIIGSGRSHPHLP